jgi:hypothetical protein
MLTKLYSCNFRGKKLVGIRRNKWGVHNEALYKKWGTRIGTGLYWLKVA